MCVQQKDVQKFNTIYDDYIRTNLAGGEMDKSDIVNFTDGKTSIMSVPDAHVDDLKKAFREVNINFATLPDLMPDDGVKQLRVANVDLNTAKYVWEDFKRALMQRGQTAENVNVDAEVTGAEIPDISIMSEEEYLNTGMETPEQWMDSASAEIKEKLEAYNQLTPTEQYMEVLQWEGKIKPSECFECQALRGNMAFTEISIDKATLVENGSVAEKLNQTSPLRDRFFFCTVPGTNREDTLCLHKGLVFEVQDADRPRYVAFIDNRRLPSTYNKNGDLDWKYDTPKDLLKHFDTNKSNEAVESLSKKLMEDVPKAAMVK